MLALLLTHAEARRVAPKTFRSLSESGRNQVHEIANHVEQIFESAVCEIRFAELTIGEIHSSPAARCVESALLFADALRDRVSSAEIRVRDRLREQREGQLSASDLMSVLDDTTSPVVLLCTHGDLASSLPTKPVIKPEFNDKGWFKPRPVLALVQYNRGSDWSVAKLLACAAMIDGRLVHLAVDEDA